MPPIRKINLTGHPKWNLAVYETDTPGFRKARLIFLSLALGFLFIGVIASIVTGSTYPFRAAGTASFIFAFLLDRLQPGYKEFWKATGYGVFFFIGGFLLHSYLEAGFLMMLWVLLLLSRWHGLKILWQEETRGYRILLVVGLISVTWMLYAFLWNQAHNASGYLERNHLSTGQHICGH